MDMDKRAIAVALALCIGLTGCATTQTVEIKGKSFVITSPALWTLPNKPGFDPQNVLVFHIKDRLVVDQEPVRPINQDPSGTYKITFFLISNSTISNGESRFGSDTAVQTVTSNAPQLTCQRRPTSVTNLLNRILDCYFDPPTTSMPKVWKYSVTVTRDSGGIITLDPSVAMD